MSPPDVVSRSFHWYVDEMHGVQCPEPMEHLKIFVGADLPGGSVDELNSFWQLGHGFESR